MFDSINVKSTFFYNQVLPSDKGTAQMLYVLVSHILIYLILPYDWQASKSPSQIDAPHVYSSDSFYVGW